MRDDNASHWLTLSLYTGLLLAFLLAACVSAAWPHLHPSSVEILAPTATTVQLELVFAAADAATLVALAPAGLRRDAAERLRDALRLLTGTRSFHNFCPHFCDSSDGAPTRDFGPSRTCRIFCNLLTKCNQDSKTQVILQLAVDDLRPRP